MDALGKLGEVEAILHGGRRVAGRVMIDRPTVLERLSEARVAIAAELREAREVVRDRDAVLEEGRREVERLRAEVAADRVRRLSDTEAGAESQRILTEAADFSERSLAELEVVLQRLLSTISRARTALHDQGSVIGSNGLRQTLVGD